MVPTLILVLFMSLLPSSHAHLWMQCPEPRQCFYESPLSSNKKHGEWRTAPCPFNPNPDRVTYLYRNETFCLRVREFVDHHGWLDVAIAGTAVSPGDDQSLFDNKLAYIEDLQNGTAFQQIEIKIPSNVTCNGTCTLQVRQWSEDLNWFYYACSDVVVIDRNDQNQTQQEKARLTSENTCQARILENTCHWETAPPLLRIMILQTTLLSVAPVLLIVGVVVILAITKCTTKEIIEDVDDEESKEPNGINSSVEQTTNDPAAVTAEDGTISNAPQLSPSFLRRALPPIGVLVLICCLYLIVVGIVISQLKQCNYATAHGSELSL